MEPDAPGTRLYRIEYEGGAYICHDVKNGGEIYVTEEVALAYDPEEKKLYLHGSLEVVESTVTETRRVRQADPEVQKKWDRLRIISGRFPAEELNKLMVTGSDMTDFLLKANQTIPELE